MSVLPLHLLLLAVVALLSYCWGAHRATARLRPRLHQLKGLAYTDHLTGLPNRRAAVEHLAHDREGELWVAMVDVRWLGVINNVLGHSVGDQLLQAVADALSAAVGSDGQAARFSGDEFLVWVPDNDDPRQPEQITELIGAALARHGAAHPDAPQPQVCIGWASTREVTRDRVLDAVGIAVAHAKASAPMHGDGATASSVRYQPRPPTPAGAPFPTRRRAVARHAVRS